MYHDTSHTYAGRRYAEAHTAQYTRKDLRRALELYTELLAAHPDAPEAAYARAQLHNIASSVVPKPDLLAAHVALARTHLAAADQPDG